MRYIHPRKNARNQRPAETVSIKEAMQAALKSYRLDYRYNYARIVNSWEEMMGATIAKRTTRLFVSKKKLYIEVNSAPLKNELIISRHKILEIVAAHIGENILEDVVIM